MTLYKISVRRPIPAVVFDRPALGKLILRKDLTFRALAWPGCVQVRAARLTGGTIRRRNFLFLQGLFC